MKKEIKAIILNPDARPQDGEVIQIGKHIIQFGGMGDGYCYSHGSFKCIDNLTNEEKTAVHNAE